jgi:uncharacterized protein (DUF305 family)
MTFSSRLRLQSATLALAAGLASNAGALAQEAPIVQPGAPGEDVRQISAEEAVQIAANRFSEADVQFMRDMIVHHFQAVQMADLVADRTSTADIVAVAGRINASQADEIAFMQGWLNERGQDAPDPANDPHAMHHHMNHGDGHDGHSMMAGMATPAQMEALAQANGTEFDALFLELMIAHHDGAVVMVDALLDESGSAYDPVLFDFVNDVRSEQNAEIRRMNAVLATLSEDPRNGLSAGFRDAGEAISNMQLVASLPKPTGFFDAENPAGLPPEIAPEDTDEEVERRFGQRAPFLSFSNTDMAFSGDLMAVGNYHGFNLYRLGESAPVLISSVVCPGGQGDVSIVGDLLLVSVQDTRARVDCGRQGVTEDISEERFRGLRIFDISNPVAPRQVGQVQTCRGSHTHSVVSSDEDMIVVYNSGTSSIRDEEEMAGCVAGFPGDEQTALFSIDVIEIPVANPAASRIVDSPRVFADDETGRIAGLWSGGDHGEGTQSTRRTDQCHDITVFPSLNLAAGACSGNGIVLDISDPRAPQRIDAVVDQGFAYWHSATFSNAGDKVLFTDEWGGGGRPRCRAQDPMDWGANAIYAINDGQLEFEGYYKIPSAQTEEENCVAHNGSIMPVPGRDVFVQSWYQGGISVLDFTDPANAYEIAYFDRGPIDPDVMVLGGYWSSYWYDGRIYGTEIVRGLDVFEMTPSEHLSENEIAAAALADQGQTFNPQQQFPVSWPDHPVVGLAYLDQLMRDEALPQDQADALYDALGRAAQAVEADERNRQLARELRDLGRDLPETSDGSAVAHRLSSLTDVIDGVARSLR